MTGSLNIDNELAVALELTGGGSGVALSAGTSASAPQQIPYTPGHNIAVCNDGSVCLWFLLGGSAVQATLASTPVLPGTKEVFRIPTDGGDYNYVSTITRSGSTTGTINFGVGT